MYGTSNIHKRLLEGGNVQERRPIMNPTEHPENQSQSPTNLGRDTTRPTHYDAIEVDPVVPLSYLRNEEGGYLGPAALENPDSTRPSRPSLSQNSNVRPTYSNNNLPNNNAGGKQIQPPVVGSMEMDSSSYQSERNRGEEGGPCSPSLSWEQRTGCEQMLLMGAAILLITIATLATAIGVLRGQGISAFISGGAYGDVPTCQSRECVRAAGYILESLDESVEPCEDFVQFACGGWYATHPVPESTFRWSMLDVLDENTLYELKHLLEEKPESEESIPVTTARQVYQACVNDSRWSELGLKPLLDLLDDIGGLPMIESNWTSDTFHLETSMAWIRRTSGQTLVTLMVSPDMRNNSQNVIYVDQGILPMSIETLVNASAAVKQSRIAYMKRTAEVMLNAKKLDSNDPHLQSVIDQDIEDMWQLIVALATISTHNNRYSNPWHTYNPMTVDQLTNITNHNYIPFKINWLDYLRQTFQKTNITIKENQRIIVQQPSYFKNLTKILNATSSRTIANFMLYQIIESMAEETSSTLRDIHETFEGPLWTFGRTSLRPWFDCAGKTRILLGMAVGQMYFKKHSLKNVTDMAKKLVSNVSGAFKDMLLSATWMSKNTSGEALKKLENMFQLVAYPEFFFNDTQMDEYLHGLPEVSTTDHFGNVMALSRWHGYRSLVKLKKQPSRDFWPSGPLEINAFYASLQNTIVIPGGVLQPPLFHHDEMAALNYGGIGSIVGHEITHGFDNSGRHFDWKGALAHWWDNDTAQLYVNRSKCFEDQYSKYNVSDLLAPFEDVQGDLKINAINSKGENIADNGGARAAWFAYKNHVSETGEELVLPGLQKYTQDQLFFMAFSRLWCMQFTPWALHYSLKNDRHAPGHFRILGTLQNMQEFSEAFSCSSGSSMNPEQKCVLW